MRYAELARPKHPARRERPHDIARLIVGPFQHDAFQAICEQHGQTQIVDVQSLGFGTARVEVLCQSRAVAERLAVAWMAHIQTDPIRPRL